MIARKRILVVASALAALPAAAQIRETSGAVVEWQVGRPIEAYKHELELRRSPGGEVYLTRDGLVGLFVHMSGNRVREIRACRHGMYTQRYAVIGVSSMEEVLRRYGDAQQVRKQYFVHGPHRLFGPKIVVAYHNLAFVFDNSPANKDRVMGRQVECVFVRDTSYPWLHDLNR